MRRYLSHFRRDRQRGCFAPRRIGILADASCIGDLTRLPSNRFEALGGDRDGQYNIRIDDQWRICFTFSEVLAEELAEIGASVAALSRALDVPQSRMAEVVAGKRSIAALVRPRAA